MKMRARVAGWLAALLLAACHTGPASEHHSALVIRNARVFDGEVCLAPRSVVVRDGLIARIAESDAVPDGQDSVDGTGCTLLPGLIDAHTHIGEEAQLAQALAFGVTTELDMMTFLPKEALPRLRAREVSDPAGAVADFRTAVSPVTCPEGLGTLFDADTPVLRDAAGAQAFVDARLEEGADYVKIMFDDRRAFGGTIPNLTPEMLLASVRAAHARHRLAVVHVTTLEGARQAAAAGADGLMHVFVDEPPDQALCELMAARGVFLVATLSTVKGAFEGPSGAELATDPRFVPFLGADALENLTRDRTRLEHGSFASVLDTVRWLHEAGVRVLAGTDVPNPGTAHGASIHTELALLVDAGLTPTEALAAATSAAADCFGLEDRGRIAPGKRADLLLVRGDPTADILATRDIVAVFERGVRVDRASLRAAEKE